ncbi:MAG: hypothetical protein WHU94_11205 [Thermogemmata sp.]|nr:hypothetical protein [Gemmataceae bacterium]
MMVVNDTGVLSDISQVLSSLQVRLEYMCFRPVPGNSAHAEVRVQASCDSHTWDLVTRKLLRLINVIEMGDGQRNSFPADT